MPDDATYLPFSKFDSLSVVRFRFRFTFFEFHFAQYWLSLQLHVYPENDDGLKGEKSMHKCRPDRPREIGAHRALKNKYVN